MMNHNECQHPSTKSERAKCRRQRAKFDGALAAVIAESVTIEAPAPAFVSIDVTAENWREHKESPVVLFTRIDDDTEAPIAEGVKITGWGKRWVNYQTADGKTKRTAVTCLGARTVEG